MRSAMLQMNLSWISGTPVPRQLSLVHIIEFANLDPRSSMRLSISHLHSNADIAIYVWLFNALWTVRNQFPNNDTEQNDSEHQNSKSKFTVDSENEMRNN